MKHTFVHGFSFIEGLEACIRDALINVQFTCVFGQDTVQKKNVLRKYKRVLEWLLGPLYCHTTL